MKKTTRNVVVLLIALFVIAAMATTSFAKGGYVTKKYWQGPLQFYSDNQPVQIGANPIIIDGTTYVPIRAAAEILGKKVEWDEATRSIKISDPQGSTNAANLAYYAQEITSKQSEISSLTKKITDLEKEYKEKIDKLEKEKKELQTKLDDANKRYGWNYSGYGNTATEIQSYLNSNRKSTTNGSYTIGLSYSVSSDNAGRYSTRIDVSGLPSGATFDTSSFRSYLQNSVMPAFTSNNYYYNNSYYNDPYYWNEKYPYYLDPKVADPYIYDLISKKYSYTPTTIDSYFLDEYRKYYGRDFYYGNYYGSDYYRGWYGYTSASFTVYVNGMSYTYSANSSGTVY